MKVRALKPLKYGREWHVIGSVLDIDDESLRAWEGAEAVEIIAASAPVDAQTPEEVYGQTEGEESAEEDVNDEPPAPADSGKTLKQLQHTSTEKLLGYAASIGLELPEGIERPDLIAAIQAREEEVYGQTEGE